MNLKNLLATLSFQTSREIPSVEIDEITQDSRTSHEKALFVCIEGFCSDGHQFAHKAYENGCRVFLAQKELTLPNDATVLLVENTRSALGTLACRFYSDPSHEIPVIGITGTKGKTTVASMIRCILEQNGVLCGYIGTNGIAFGNTAYETVNTTPDAITLQKTLREMVDAGCRAAVLEISSQALLLDRVQGMRFSCGVFTNLFSDHIGAGEHRDFEDYKRCKRKLFSDFEMETVVYHSGDPYASEMTKDAIANRKIACTLENTADYCAQNIVPYQTDRQLGTTFLISHNSQSVTFEIPMIGSGNALNGLLATAVARECFGISLRSAADALRDVMIAGRSEIIPLESGALAIIDYAHNGESLRQLLLHLKQFRHNRLICLFGSVGERTRIRRRELGEAAAQYADLCILTSDNPGKEDPQKILDEIAEVFLDIETPYRCIVDREDAIREAMEIAQAGDFLVLAGKGHETYQLIGSEKRWFCEREILRSSALKSV